MTTLIQAFARARRAFLALLLVFTAAGAHAQITVDLSVSPFSGGVVAQGESVPIRVTVSNSSGLSFTNITFNINSSANVQLIGGFSGGNCTPPNSVLPVNPQRVAVTIPALGPNASCGFFVDTNSLAPGPATLDAPAGGQVTAGGFDNYMITGLPALQVNNTNSGDPNSLDTTIAYLLDHCTGSDVITFNIPGAGPHQIDRISSLPSINCAGTTIDGYTQPGSSPNTNTGPGSNANIQIFINGSSCSFCGNGLSVSAPNVTVRGLAIGGFTNNGLFVFGANAVIRGNFFGISPAGAAAPNGLSGVSGTSDFATIGGPTPADRNLITGSNAYGTSFGGSNVVYENNAIGGDRNGAAGIRNNAEGIFLTSGSHSIRNNVIAFNGTAGVTLATSAQATLQSNFITTNLGPGVRVQTDSNSLIANQIGGNTTGIDMSGSFNLVAGGIIEMNSADGIAIGGNANRVAGSLIRANGGAGIRVLSGNDNVLTQAAISGNGASGIVLGAGPGGAPNDEATPPYDQDTGPNGLANRPVITSVQTVGGTSTFIAGTVKTLPDRPVRVEFFSNSTPQTVGNGETSIGSNVTGTTDGNGLFAFFANVSGVFTNVTATSTVDRCSDGCEETSEYSFPSVAAVPSAGPLISASPATLTFGPQPSGTFSPVQTSTLTNSGPGDVTITSITGTGDYQFTTDCGPTLPQGMSCFLDVQFHPLTTGVRNGTITIVSNAATSPFTISLTGTGLDGLRPAIALQPDALVFEAVELGSRSDPQAIRLVNSGTGDLNIRGFDTVGDFTILRGESRGGDLSSRGKRGHKASRIVTAPPFTTCGDIVFAGSDCLIVIEFEPGARGPREGALIIESDAPTPTVTARLTGQGGTGPTNALEIASVLDFGSQFFGSRSVGREIFIRNLTDQRATLIDVVVEGADFTVGDTCREIAAREVCAITVFFKPTTLGLRTGSLALRNQTEGAAYRVDLRGIGAPNPTPLLSLSVSAIGFGTATGPRSSTVRVTNEGQQPITISLVSATGDFMAISRCGNSLAVGGTCDIDVTFFAALTGLRTGYLRLDSNAQGSPHLVELSAVGCRAPSTAFGRTRALLCATGN
jgi:hypothetical protein